MLLLPPFTQKGCSSENCVEGYKAPSCAPKRRGHTPTNASESRTMQDKNLLAQQDESLSISLNADRSSLLGLCVRTECEREMKNKKTNVE